MSDTMVFAVVVTYNGMQWVDRCMGSLCQSVVPVSVVVVDNASTDGIVQYIQQNYPDVHVIETGSNSGFAKANNLGIRYALDHGADYVFLLNQDAWLNETDGIRRMLSVFERESNIGIVNPINMNGLNTALDDEYATDMPGSFVSDMYMGTIKEYYSTHYINAAAWLMSAACIRKVGGFDTNMFVHYGEDNNYCHRTVYHQFKIMICTQCTICHDKEYRRGKEQAYRDRNFKQRDLSDRIFWGNINVKVDVDGMLKSLKRSILWNSITLRFWKIKRFKTQQQFYRMVKLSRTENSKGGMVWL